MDPDKLKTLETLYQTRIEKGHYWYDKVCGAWGVEDGPTVGFIPAGLDLAGPMPPDISGGGTLAGDGQGGHMYSGRNATGKSVFWYPGM